MRRLTGLVPTLLLCALLPSHAAASDAAPSERDNQFDAVKSLIEREYRLPAKRQLDDFKAANYPDADLYLKTLNWFYADRFRVLSPDKAEKEALAKQVKELAAELDVAVKSGKCPEIVKNTYGGIGKVLRLVNDILGLVDPDRPLDVSGVSGISDERKAAVNQAVIALAAEVKSTFDDAAKAIKAGAAADEDAVAKNNMKGIEAATMARLEAIRPVALAHRAFREVAERGSEFGLDPAPALKFLKEFATANFAMLQDWDYAFGDYHPYLHAFLMEVTDDGARFKVKNARFEDLEADTMRTIEIDAGHDFGGQSAVAEEVRTLQARTWAMLFNWYRDLGRDVGPKYWQHGLEQWQAFKEKTRTDKHFRLDHPNHERAVEMARAYFAAARLLQAKGDTNGAMAIFNQVAGTKDQPLAPHARMWVQYLINPPGTDPGKADWGSQAVAADPAGAIDTARAYMKVADQTGDEAKARQFRIRAAMTLRNGALGLANATDQDKADEVAPELWFRYAYVLNQLGLRWHAAVASQEGLKQIKTRMAELPKPPNVWQAKDKSWTRPGNYVSLLSRNAITYAQILLLRAKGPGVSELYDNTVSLVNVISPADTGRSLERLQMQVRLSEKDWDGAIEASKGYVKKYPEDKYWVASNIVIVGMLGKRAEAASAGSRKQIEADTVAFAEATAKEADADLQKATDPARKRELLAVKGDVLLVRATLMLDDDPGQVLDLLGPEYWSHPPVEDKTAKAVDLMCTAARKYYALRAKDPKVTGDVQALLADWARYQQCYQLWHKQKARVPSQADKIEAYGASLAQTFVNIGNWAERMRAAVPASSAQLAEVSKAAYTAFSDMIEPRLDKDDKPNLVLATANIIWDLDDHPRAARLYQIFVDQVAKDPEASALRETPKDVLNPLDGIITARPEFKPQWAAIRDLLEDAPGLVDNILSQDLPQDKWGEQKIDYVKAVAAIQALRKDADRRRIEIGATYAQIDEGLAKLEDTTSTLAREISCIAKLAIAYREMGGDKAELATKYYNRLIAYDPTNPEYLAAAVELVIKQLKDGDATVSEDVLKTTQIKAARVRDAAAPGSPTYWTAVIQVLELSNALKDTKSIDKRLIFDAQNRSTPADDLQLLPREARDDKRVRRARNAISVDLCRRYLELFKLPGVNAKPSFDITTIDLDGKEVTLFVPVGDVKFAPQKRELEDGTTVWFVWEEGKTPPPEAAPAEPEKAAPAEPEKAAAPVAPEKEKKP